MPSRTATILTTALAPLIWGSTYLVTTEFLPPDRPFTAALIRVLPAGLLLLAWTRRIPKRDEWATVVLLGFLNIGFFQAMLFVAAYRLPGGLAAVLSSTQTLMVLVFTWLIGKTMPPKAAWAWSAAGVLGIALLVLSPQARYDGTGILAALAGAARWRWVCICRNTAALRCPYWRSPAGSFSSADYFYCPSPCLPNRGSNL